MIIDVHAKQMQFQWQVLACADGGELKDAQRALAVVTLISLPSPAQSHLVVSEHVQNLHLFVDLFG